MELKSVLLLVRKTQTSNSDFGILFETRVSPATNYILKYSRSSFVRSFIFVTIFIH